MIAEHYGRSVNSPLAEQRNAMLRKIETQLAHMKQTNALYYLRYYLHKMNEALTESKFW
jgi:hypothetical protein